MRLHFWYWTYDFAPITPIWVTRVNNSVCSQCMHSKNQTNGTQHRICIFQTIHFVIVISSSYFWFIFVFSTILYLYPMPKNNINLYVIFILIWSEQTVSTYHQKNAGEMLLTLLVDHFYQFCLFFFDIPMSWHWYLFLHVNINQRM